MIKTDGVYLPTKSELYARGEMLQWMRGMSWDWDVIDRVLYDDCPSPRHVRVLVYRHGPDRAYELLRMMQS